MIFIQINIVLTYYIIMGLIKQGGNMKYFISIDWGYFMNYMKIYNESGLENKNNIIEHWYKMYIQKN